METGLIWTVYAYGYFAVLCLVFGALIAANMMLGDRTKRDNPE